MNCILTIMLGLLATGIGCLFGMFAILSLLGFTDQQLPQAVLFLVFATSFTMLFLGSITLTTYAYETNFDKDSFEMHFVFRKERLSWESFHWYRKICFRNTISGGANVWVLMKYAISDGNVTRFRRAVLLVVEAGSAVGMTVGEFQTPFDTWKKDLQKEKKDRLAL